MSQVLPVSPLIHLLSDVSYFILAAPFIVYERLPPKLDSTDVALLRTLAWPFFFFSSRSISFCIRVRRLGFSSIRPRRASFISRVLTFFAKSSRPKWDRLPSSIQYQSMTKHFQPVVHNPLHIVRNLTFGTF